MSNNAMSLENIAKGIKISDLYHIKPKLSGLKPKHKMATPFCAFKTFTGFGF
jgi:hypothetical protein